MTQVLEDTDVVIVPDLDESVPCGTDRCKPNPNPATWRGILPCNHNALLCEPCKVTWQIILSVYIGGRLMECSQCGTHFTVQDIRFEPLPR